MKNWFFHSLNIITLVVITVFCVLAWFGTSMSAGDTPHSIYFAIITSFIWWGIFYFIQIQKQTSTWRFTWFFISVIILTFWLTGGGSSIWNSMFS